jgi:hypothetical protein
MKRFLKAIIQAGVRPEMSVREARFIKACNIVAIVTVVWVLLVIPTVFPFRPAVRNVVIAGAACGLGLCLVPVLNGYGLYRTAQMYAATISMCTVTFNALQFGHAAWNHLLLLGGILVSFYSRIVVCPHMDHGVRPLPLHRRGRLVRFRMARASRRHSAGSVLRLHQEHVSI